MHIRQNARTITHTVKHMKCTMKRTRCIYIYYIYTNVCCINCLCNVYMCLICRGYMSCMCLKNDDKKLHHTVNNKHWFSLSPGLYLEFNSEKETKRQRITYIYTLPSLQWERTPWKMARKTETAQSMLTSVRAWFLLVCADSRIPICQHQ